MATHSPQPDPTPILQEADAPFPPPFYWLKRLTLANVALLVLLVILRLVWGFVAERRLSAEIARIRAAGEPIMPEDFIDPPIPDSENAAFYMSRALTSLKFTRQQQALVDDDRRWRKMTPADLAIAQQLKASCAATLNDVRTARSCWAVAWQPSFRSPICNTYPNYRAWHRSSDLSNLFAVIVAYEHEMGDDGAAVEHLRDLLAAPRAVYPCIDSTEYFWARRCSDLATSRILSHARSLRIEGDTSATAPSGQVTPASRQQIRSLIGELLDESAISELQHRSLLGVRMMNLDLARYEADRNLLFRGLFQMEAARLMQLNQADLESLDQTTWPAAKPYYDRLHQSPETSSRAGEIASCLRFIAGGHRLGSFSFERLADRRMAAVVLAMRLYMVDHIGSRPKTLEELVPTYLPAVPRDPFAADQSDIRYSPRTSDPIIYSVAQNGIDDGGSEKQANGQQATYRWGALDAIVPLTRPSD